MSTLEGLKFRWGNTSIHELHPLVKLLFAVGVSGYALVFSSFPILIILLASQITLIVVAKVEKEWMKTLLGATGVVLLVFVLSFGVNLSGDYFGQGVINLEPSLIAATYSTMKWLVFFASFTLFFLTTSPEDLSVAMEEAHIPYTFCFAMATAVRFIPALANDLEHIMDAQRSRGLDLESANPLKRIWNLRPLLLPLIANAIRRSLDLEEALYSKAFGVSKRRTHLYELTFGRWDVLFLVAALVLISTSIYYGRLSIMTLFRR